MSDTKKLAVDTDMEFKSIGISFILGLAIGASSGALVASGYWDGRAARFACQEDGKLLRAHRGTAVCEVKGRVVRRRYK